MHFFSLSHDSRSRILLSAQVKQIEQALVRVEKGTDLEDRRRVTHVSQHNAPAICLPYIRVERFQENLGHQNWRVRHDAENRWRDDSNDRVL